METGWRSIAPFNKGAKMRRWIIGAVVAAAVASPMVASAATQQFDLICAGTSRLGDGPAEPYGAEFRIDLTKKEYCAGECSATLPIQQVLSNLIVFNQKNLDGAGPGDLENQTVSRTDGAYRSVLVSRRPLPFTSKIEAHCRVAAFKPFPAAKF